MKSAIITGGTQGIGKATALKLAQCGYTVAVCSRSEANLKSMEEELEQFGEGHLVLACDMRDKDEISAFAEIVQRQFGAIDVLVNNVGTYIPGTIAEEDDGVLELMLDVNLKSGYYLTRALLPNMKKEKRGTIINICSTASKVAYVNGGSYCISKFAQLGMTKVLREELKPHNIAVTAILPGATLTASWDGVDLPPERFIQASQIAEVVYQTIQLAPGAVIEEITVRPMDGDIT